jgi:hypothetical protein
LLTGGKELVVWEVGSEEVNHDMYVLDILMPELIINKAKDIFSNL